MQRSLLVITFSTWSSFNDTARLSFKVFDLIALINSWVIRLMIWVIQDIEFCALFHEMSRQLSTLSSFFFRVSLLLALLITTSKSLFLMSYVFKILNSSCIKWWSVCSTWRDVNSIRCSWYWNVAFIQYIKTFREATFWELDHAFNVIEICRDSFKSCFIFARISSYFEKIMLDNLVQWTRVISERSICSNCQKCSFSMI